MIRLVFDFIHLSMSCVHTCPPKCVVIHPHPRDTNRTRRSPMARKIRDSALQTRTGRLALPVRRKPHFVRIGLGISLGYRRNNVGGTWVLRVANGKGGAATKAIGSADDYDDANGDDVLTFLGRPRAGKNHRPRRHRFGQSAPLTIRVAAEIYLDALQARNANSARDARGRLNKHFLPALGDVLITDLTKTRLDRWLAGLVSRSDDAENVRRSKDSANRVLSMVKALLNHAMHDPTNGLTDDHAWRLVKPFKGVGEARRVHFTMEQARALIEAAPRRFCRFAHSRIFDGCAIRRARPLQRLRL